MLRSLLLDSRMLQLLAQSHQRSQRQQVLNRSPRLFLAVASQLQQMSSSREGRKRLPRQTSRKSKVGKLLRTACSYKSSRTSSSCLSRHRSSRARSYGFFLGMCQQTLHIAGKRGKARSYCTCASAQLLPCMSALQHAFVVHEAAGTAAGHHKLLP